ncbi:MAG: carotenoid biosynthesis protein [Rubrobacteraceae bacterium]
MLKRILKDTPPRLLQVSVALFVISFFPVYLSNFPGSGVASLLTPFLMALPAILGLFLYLGPLRAGLSLLALTAFAYAIETIGVLTGFPYGPFHYGDVLGPKVFGVVPYLLPVTYLPLVIGAVAAAWGTRGRISHIIAAAVLLTLMDGVLDPGAAALGFWVWLDGGLYYGVPLGNYLGWLFSGVLAAGIALAVGRWNEPPLPIMLDSAIVAVAFWTGVAAFTFLPMPALLGIGMFGYLILRRSKLVASEPARSGAGRYKLSNG